MRGHVRFPSGDSLGHVWNALWMSKWKIIQPRKLAIATAIFIDRPRTVYEQTILQNPVLELDGPHERKF
jgi:hypothetical protein